MDREMDRADRQTYRHIFPHFRCCSLFLDMVVERKVQWPLWWSFCKHSNTLILGGKKAEWILGGVTSQKSCTCCPYIWHTIVGFNHFYFLPSFQVAFFLVIHQLESRTVFFLSGVSPDFGLSTHVYQYVLFEKEGNPKSNVLSLLSLVHHHFHFPLMACYFRACCIPHSVTDLYFEM